MPLRQSSGMLPELQTERKIVVSHLIPSEPAFSAIQQVGYTDLATAVLKVWVGGHGGIQALIFNAGRRPTPVTFWISIAWVAN